MEPIWQAQLGESLVMLIGPSWEKPNSFPIGNQILGPFGQEDVCPNFALTVTKFVSTQFGGL